MENYVVFKDNHTEPILWYSDKPGRVEVLTPSGKYLYCEYIVTHPNGYHHTSHHFYRYRGIDYRRDDWIGVDNIKEFRFKKEN